MTKADLVDVVYQLHGGLTKDEAAEIVDTIFRTVKTSLRDGRTVKIKNFGTFEVMGKATRYYREQCARHGWQPSPEQIVYRANMLVAETDEEAHALLRAQSNQAPFTMRPGVRDAMMTLDSRNIAGQARSPVVSGALPTTFIGSPDTVVEQVRRCREVVGAGVLDLSLHPPGSGDLGPLTRALELFGAKVLPRIREI